MNAGYGQISRIHIAGYKTIKNCDLELNRINVLIGSNGAGKSNFISAFSLLQNVLSKNLQVSASQSGINSLFYNGKKQQKKLHLRFSLVRILMVSL
jgi:predicted ATPase